MLGRLGHLPEKTNNPEVQVVILDGRAIANIYFLFFIFCYRKYATTGLYRIE